MPENYAQIATEYYRITKDVSKFSDLEMDLSFFLEFLSGTSILDAGAGSCRDSLYFLSKGFDVEAVDSCVELLSISRNFPASKKRVMDVRSLAYKDMTFSGVWSNAVLLHLDEQGIHKALLEFKRVLKPNGILYISIKEGEGKEKVSFSATKVFRTFYYYNLKDLTTLLSDAGLRVIKIWKKTGLNSESLTTNWLKVLASR